MRKLLNFNTSLLPVVSLHPSNRLLPDQRVSESEGGEGGEGGDGERGRVILLGTSVSVEVSTPPPSLSLLVSWSHSDEDLGDYVINTVQRNLPRLL